MRWWALNESIQLKLHKNALHVNLKQPSLTVKTEKPLILMGNYPDLQNLPKINGVTLVGDKSAAELSLLSSKAADYPTMRLGAVRDTHYVPILGETNGKIRLSDIAGTKLSTVSEIPEDMAVGDYIFLEKE